MAHNNRRRAATAKPVQSNIKGKLHQLIKAHQSAFYAGVRALKESPLSTWLAVLAIGIVLVLPLSGYLVFNQINQLHSKLDSGHEVTAFVEGKLSQTKIDQIIANLNTIEEIQSITHQTPESALREFEAKTDIGDLVNLLPSNPLPHVLVITPKAEYQSPQSMQALQSLLLKNPEIDQVVLDIEFIQKLEAVNQLVAKGVLLISLFIGIGCVVILSNTIRLSLERHRDEIYIFSLMGATESYIRRPFVYRAMIYGLLGACTAIALVMLALFMLKGPMASLAQLYQQVVTIDSIPLVAVASLVIFSVLLSIFSAKLAIWQYNEKLS